MITIHLDPQRERTATIAYESTPLKKVCQDRGGNTLRRCSTPIMAWKNAVATEAGASSIATFNGAWLSFCRHPLIWLGLFNPATALLDQLNRNPDSEDFSNLMKHWHAVF